MKRREKGLTLISWIVILSMIGFVSVQLVRVIPIYSEYYAVVNVMKGIKVEIKNNKLSGREVRELLTKRLLINKVKNVKRENIKLSRGRSSLSIRKVVIDYDVEVPFIAQLNLIGHFHQEIDVESKR